eukprot:scaffold2256_cov166-Amphora_coffeaeformis.AAC.10
MSDQQQPQLPSELRINYGSLLEIGGATATGSDSAKTAEAWQVQSHKWALGAGILYTLIIVCGIFSEVGLRGSLIDYNDTTTTITNIQDSPTGLRWSLLLDLTMSVSDVALSILLGAVLWAHGADKLFTVMAMVFRIVQQAILASNLLHLFVASLLLDTSLPWRAAVAAWLSMSDEEDGNNNIGENGSGSGMNIESLAMLFLYLHKYGYAVALVFFGVSMILLGGVIWNSRIFPRWLGAATSLAGVGYVLDSTAYFGVHGYTGDGIVSQICMLPVFVAEFGLAGWLLFRKPVPAV